MLPVCPRMPGFHSHFYYHYTNHNLTITDSLVNYYMQFNLDIVTVLFILCTKILHYMLKFQILNCIPQSWMVCLSASSHHDSYALL